MLHFFPEDMKMNKKSIYAMALTISMSCLCVTTNAETITSTNFNSSSGYGSDFLQLLFDDDFNTENGWLNNDSYKLSNGWYEIEGSNSGYNTSLLDIYLFDIEGDYLIEAKFEKIYGKNDGGYGLIWGAKNNKNFYGFYISGNGGFNYGKVEKDNWVPITKWKSSEFINKYNTGNTISILKKGNSLKFHVNGKLVHEDTAPILKGIKVGFSTSTPKIRIDYLKIRDI